MGPTFTDIELSSACEIRNHSKIPCVFSMSLINLNWTPRFLPTIVRSGFEYPHKTDRCVSSQVSVEATKLELHVRD
jgi:hypothetical protein